MLKIEDLEELYLKRQSCRSFSDKAVEKEKLEKITSLASLSPSACNSQPWSMAVVTGEKLPSVIKACQDMGMNGFVSKAQSLIVIYEENASLSEKVGAKFKNQDFVSNDLGILTAHIILAAEVLGLSTCILGWINSDKINSSLELKDKKRARLVIAVGYASEGYAIREKKRKKLTDTVKFYE